MPGRNLRLLSLDGGGIRGLSSLEILQQLMERINPISPPKPCDYFDMIGGTSTGGLIAIMLGRLEMSVEECKEAYCKLSERVFRPTKHRLTLKGRVQGRFDSNELESAIKEILQSRNLHEDTLLKSAPDAKCNVFVCATSYNTGTTTYLTSYQTPRGSRLLKVAKIWEAGRATSAATSFFDSIKIGTPQAAVEFVDGATGANNPVKDLMVQATDFWGIPAKENLKCLVSIGTGRPSLTDFGDTPIKIVETLVKQSTQTERTAEDFSRENSDLEDNNRYFRFNVESGLEKVGLEETKEMGRITAVTDNYIQSQNVYKKLGFCAEQLKSFPDEPVVSQSVLAGEVSTSTSKTNIFCCPYTQNDTFVGRKDLLLKLDELLKIGAAKEKQSRVGLYGLGGIGKTQIAIEIAFRSYANYHIFLANGSTKEDLENTYISIGRQAAILLDSMKEEQCISIVKEWLDSEESGSWRLIIENVDEFESDIEDLLPKRRGAILFTSRNRDTLDPLAMLPSSILRVPMMEISEAAEMLVQCTGLSAGTDANNSGVDNNFDQMLDARTLVEDLECLPLAIAQAAGYLRKNQQISLKKYAAMLKSFTDDQYLGDQKFTKHFMRPYNNTGQIAAGPPQSIMTTWNVSLSRIVEANPQAERLLQVLSLLAYDGVTHDTLRPELLQDLGLDDIDLVNDAIGLLISYSLISITWKEDKCSYNMHRFVSVWTRTNIQDKDMISTAALKIVVDAFPLSVIGSTIQGNEILPHARAVIRYCTENRISTGRQGVGLNYRIGRHLYFVGAFSEAKTCLETSVRYFEDHKENGADSLDCRYYLGLVLSAQSNLAGAYEHFDRVYKEMLQGLGEDDPNTIEVYCEVARIVRIRGQKTTALEMYQNALNLRKIKAKSDNFGSQDYLTIVEGLGSTYQALGDYQEAAKWFTYGLNGAVEKYGQRSVLSFNMTFDLMETLEQAGESDQAVSVFDNFMYEFQESSPEDPRDQLPSRNSTINKSERLKLAFPVACELWGEDSNRVLSYMDYMALTMADEGKTEESFKLHREAFELSKRNHGLNHMTTLGIANNMAAKLGQMRRYDEALTYLKSVQEGSRSIFEGKINPMTVAATEKIAQIYFDEGAYDDAREVIDTLFEEMKDTLIMDALGDETLAAYNLRGCLCRESGHTDKAVKYHKVAANGFGARYGPDSPAALMATVELAETLIENRRTTEALSVVDKVYETIQTSQRQGLACFELEVECLRAKLLAKTKDPTKALQLIDKLLSENTSESYLAVSNMMHIKAECLESLKRWKEALQWFDKSLELRKQNLSDYHPHTLTTALAKTFALSNIADEKEFSNFLHTFRLAHERFGKSQPTTQ